MRTRRESGIHQHHAINVRKGQEDRVRIASADALVQQQDIGALRGHLRDRRGHVGRFADDLEIGLGLDDAPKPVTHQRVIVRQYDSRFALHVVFPG